MKKSILMLGLVTLLSGCSSGIEDLEQYVADQKAQPKGSVNKVPDSPDYSPVPYQAVSDPFFPLKPVMMASPLMAKGESGVANAKAESRALDPLESYALDQLKMIGVVKNQSGKKVALVQGPDKRVHMVSVGQHLGQNAGKILSIDDGEIKLLERFLDNKKWESKEATLKRDN